MNLYSYTVKGDSAALRKTWESVIADLGKDELFLNLVVSTEDGITILDVCPTDADFQGWINGDDWRRIRAQLGGEVEVSFLGSLDFAVARDNVVEVVPSHAHA